MLSAVFVSLALAANLHPLPPGPGREIVAHTCKSCHALKVVTAKRATKAQWSVVVNQMISRGAEVPDDAVETLVNYLAKNFGPDSKLPVSVPKPVALQAVNVNQASAAELAKALGLSAQESAAIVSYRRQNGDFKDWRDLAQVPGLDAQQIERCKDRLVF